MTEQIRQADAASRKNYIARLCQRVHKGRHQGRRRDFESGGTEWFASGASEKVFLYPHFSK